MVFERSAGVLLHITSLPGNLGIGTLGKEAMEFADLLVSAGQSYWQILPIGPAVSVFGYSPYATISAFAGNPLFISPESVAGEEWCGMAIDSTPFSHDHRVNFEQVERWRDPFFRETSRRFFLSPERDGYGAFCEGASSWLEDYALFAALSARFGTCFWPEWDADIAMREPKALARWRKELEGEMDYHRFLQYLFFRQWNAFREYCNTAGIKLIGDIPIYIAMESADAWANPGILDLDETTGRPLCVAGVPPDYFSSTGQRWGNPLYRWRDARGKLNPDTVVWWKKRIAHLKDMVDVVRIDHFRGFESYWSIPAEEDTAVKGEWVEGPGIEFFQRLKDGLGELPLIAEDLGVITGEVRSLRDELGLPGMKILQFAFDFNNRNEYLPHNFENHNCVLYTGTHDNNTTNGWFYGHELDNEGREYVMEYAGSIKFNDFHWQLIRLAYRSVANCVIIPAQDIMGYGAEFRMNMPGTTNGNWGWKLLPGAITPEMTSQLCRMAEMYNRAGKKRCEGDGEPPDGGPVRR